MDPDAPNGQRTLFDVGCTKRKRSEGDGQPGELCIRQDPTLAQRVAERERVLAAAIAARPPPAPPRPVDRPRLERPAPSFIIEKPVVWVQQLPLRLPSHQVHVSLRLHFSGRAAVETEKATEWDNQQRVWLRLEVDGKGHVHVQLRASPFPMLKQWSEWNKEFALSMADRFGRGGRCAAVHWLQQHFSSRSSTLGERQGGGEAGAPGVAGAGAQARGRMQLIKKHRAQEGVGAGAGAGAGGGRGLGKS